MVQGSDAGGELVEIDEEGKRKRSISRPREEARDAYNRLSRIYDFLTSGGEEKIKKSGIELLNPSDGERVLEIGCGTGKGLLEIAQRIGSDGRVFGIDISEGMLEIAARRINEAGLSETISITRGDAVNLPYDDGTFDAVFMSFTLELFSQSDIALVLAECIRVLKPDGRIGIVAMSEKSKEGFMKKAYLWAHNRFPKYVDCRPIFAGNTLSENGLGISISKLEYLFGLPVEIVVGRKI